MADASAGKGKVGDSGGTGCTSHCLRPISASADLGLSGTTLLSPTRWQKFATQVGEDS